MLFSSSQSFNNTTAKLWTSATTALRNRQLLVLFFYVLTGFGWHETRKVTRSSWQQSIEWTHSLRREACSPSIVCNTPTIRDHPGEGGGGCKVLYVNRPTVHLKPLTQMSLVTDSTPSHSITHALSHARTHTHTCAHKWVYEVFFFKMWQLMGKYVFWIL